MDFSLHLQKIQPLMHVILVDAESCFIDWVTSLNAAKLLCDQSNYSFKTCTCWRRIKKCCCRVVASASARMDL